MRAYCLWRGLRKTSTCEDVNQSDQWGFCRDDLLKGPDAQVIIDVVTTLDKTQEGVDCLVQSVQVLRIKEVREGRNPELRKAKTNFGNEGELIARTGFVGRFKGNGQSVVGVWQDQELATCESRGDISKE